MKRAAVLAALLLTSGCDRASRVGGEAKDHRFSQLYEQVLDPFFARQPGPDGAPRFAAQRVGASALSAFPAAKAAGGRRIFVIGGTEAQHFNKGHLEGMLRRVLPGVDLQIVDCGMPYYDSARDLLVAQEVLRYEPDLLILMSGADEGMPAAVAGPVGRGQALRALLRGALKLRPLDSAKLLLRGSSLETGFESNLRAMVRAAKSRRVPVLLCTLPWDLRDTPPAGTLPLDKRAFFEAWFQYERGDTAAAARFFASYLKSQTGKTSLDRAFAEYYLGRSLEAEGDASAAREHYLRASELETPPMAALNAVVRRLSQEEGVLLADLDEAFAKAHASGLPGAEVFDDPFRWTRDWDPGAAGTMLKALAAASAQQPILGRGPWDGAAVETAASPHQEPEKPGDRTAGWTSLMLGLWGLDTARDGRFQEPLVCAMERLVERRPDVLAKPEALQKWFIEKLVVETGTEQAQRQFESRMPVLLAHLGEACLRRGDFARSMRFFDESIGLDAAMPQLRLRKCVALSGMGKRREALQGLEELRGVEEILPEVRFYREMLQQRAWPRIARNARPAAPRPQAAPEKKVEKPRTAEEWLQLALGAKEAGRDEEALAALGAAAKAGCGPDLAARLSQEYASLGKPEAALPLIRSLADKPAEGTAISWLALASVAYGRGDRGLGLRLMARAEAAGPDGQASAEIARSYSQAGEGKRAGPMVLRAAGLGSAALSGQDWLRLAHIAQESGDKGAGINALERAQKAGGASGLEVAKAYAAFKEPRLAIAALQPVVKDGQLTAAGYLDASHVAAEAGDRELARKALTLASAADPGGALKPEIARSYVKMGAFKDAAPSIHEITGALSAKDWLDMARSAHASGEAEVAAEAVGRAMVSGPEPAVQAGCARLYAELGKAEQALPIAKTLVAAGASVLSSDGWADVGYAAGRSGDRETALKAFALVDASALGFEGKRAMAVRYQELKDYDRALSLLDGLVAADPGNHDLLSDRGVLKALMGRTPEAIEDLQRAVEIDIRHLDGVLTLGGLLSSAGRKQEALALYDKALKRAAAAEEAQPAYRLIKEERDKLAGKR